MECNTCIIFLFKYLAINVFRILSHKGVIVIRMDALLLASSPTKYLTRNHTWHLVSIRCEIDPNIQHVNKSIDTYPATKLQYAETIFSSDFFIFTQKLWGVLLLWWLGVQHAFNCHRPIEYFLEPVALVITKCFASFTGCESSFRHSQTTVLFEKPMNVKVAYWRPQTIFLRNPLILNISISGWLARYWKTHNTRATSFPISSSAELLQFINTLCFYCFVWYFIFLKVLCNWLCCGLCHDNFHLCNEVISWFSLVL